MPGREQISLRFATRRVEACVQLPYHGQDLLEYLFQISHGADGAREGEVKQPAAPPRLYHGEARLRIEIPHQPRPTSVRRLDEQVPDGTTLRGVGLEGVGDCAQTPAPPTALLQQREPVVGFWPGGGAMKAGLSTSAVGAVGSITILFMTPSGRSGVWTLDWKECGATDQSGQVDHPRRSAARSASRSERSAATGRCS